MAHFDPERLWNLCWPDGREAPFALDSHPKIVHKAPLPPGTSPRTGAETCYPCTLAARNLANGQVAALTLGRHASGDASLAVNAIAFTAIYAGPDNKSWKEHAALIRRMDGHRSIWIQADAFADEPAPDAPLAVPCAYTIAMACLLEALLIEPIDAPVLRTTKTLFMHRENDKVRTNAYGTGLLSNAGDDLRLYLVHGADPNGTVETDLAFTDELPAFHNLIMEDALPTIVDEKAINTFRNQMKSGGLEAVKPPPTLKVTIPDFGFHGPQARQFFLAAKMGYSCMLTGPTGAGKTFLVHRFIDKMGWPSVEIPGAEGLTDLDLQGSPVKTVAPDGQQIIRWIDGRLTQAYRMAAEIPADSDARVLLFFDEITRIQPKYQNLLVAAMNVHTDGCCHLPLYGKVDPETGAEEVVKAPADKLFFVGARNVGIGYNVKEQDRALMRRFKSKIEFNYLPKDRLAALIRDQVAGTESLAHAVAYLAEETRKLVPNRQLRAPLDDASAIVLASAVLTHVRDFGVRMDVEGVWEVALHTVVPEIVAREATGELVTTQVDVLKDIWIRAALEAKFNEEPDPTPN